MGDRLATIDICQKVGGLLCLSIGSAVLVQLTAYLLNIINSSVNKRFPDEMKKNNVAEISTLYK